MKSFDGFKSEAPAAAFPMLPAGAYVAAIKDVRLDGAEPDQSLMLRLEIIEGEWAGYYTRRFQHDAERSSGNPSYDPKYKGVYRLRIPNAANPNARHLDWDVRAFNNAIWAVEQSNEGYHWDWKEENLRNKTVGINVREGTYNGSPFTRIGRLESAEAVRAGRVRPMKPLPDVTTPGTQPGFTLVDEEIPF